MLSDIKHAIELSAIKFCEDSFPYRLSFASYDDGYKLPCTSG